MKRESIKTGEKPPSATLTRSNKTALDPGKFYYRLMQMRRNTKVTPSELQVKSGRSKSKSSVENLPGSDDLIESGEVDVEPHLPKETDEALPIIGTSKSGGDVLVPTLQAKYDNLYKALINETALREEAEKAFNNIVELHKVTIEELADAVDSTRKLCDIVDEDKNQNEELRGVAAEMEFQLTGANEKIMALEEMVAEEKRSGDMLLKEIGRLKSTIDHSACKTLLEKEQSKTAKANERIEDLQEDLIRVKDEKVTIKEENRDLMNKVADIISMKNELAMQNQMFSNQLNTFQDIINSKDEQIAQLLIPQNPFDDFVVQEKIEEFKAAFNENQKMWEFKENEWKKQMEAVEASKTQVQDMLDGRQKEMEAMCKRYELTKRELENQVKLLSEQFEMKENETFALAQAMKELKKKFTSLHLKKNNLEKEVKLLAEQSRVKDVEISVLGDAKRLFEEQIQKYKFERDAVFQIAKQFEEQIESAREKLKELESCKSALHEQLKVAHCKIQEERDLFKIQEKILEDSRDTVAMLKCKLRECNHKLHKAEREKQMLLREKNCRF